ncbi:DNA-3-methyladenine glycosylase I, partial [Staphylococcus aureus]
NQRVVDQKWEAFEEAFHRFSVGYCAALHEDELDGLMRNRSIVRNGAKIESVVKNAQLVRDLAGEHGSAARFFADWPD